MGHRVLKWPLHEQVCSRYSKKRGGIMEIQSEINSQHLWKGKKRYEYILLNCTESSVEAREKLAKLSIH
jgi:hypothetical protein